MHGGAPLSHAAWIEMRKNGIASSRSTAELGGMALIGSGMAPYGASRRCPASPPRSSRRRRATWCSPACSRSRRGTGRSIRRFGRRGCGACAAPRANAPGAAWPTGDVFRSEGGKVGSSTSNAREGDQLSPVWLRHVCRADSSRAHVGRDDQPAAHRGGADDQARPPRHRLRRLRRRPAVRRRRHRARRARATARLAAGVAAARRRRRRRRRCRERGAPHAGGAVAGGAGGARRRERGRAQYSRLPSKPCGWCTRRWTSRSRAPPRAASRPTSTRALAAGSTRRSPRAATAAAAVKAAKEGGGGGGGGDVSVVVDSMAWRRWSAAPAAAAARAAGRC